MAIGLAHPDTGGLFRREEQTKVSGFATATMEPPSRASRGRRGSPAAKRITAMPDDAAMETRVREVMPKGGSGAPVPLVRIADRPALRTEKRSAA